MYRVVEVLFPNQLVAEVKPMLAQGRMDLGDYIVEAVTWYTRYLRQEQTRPGTVSWADINAGEQAWLLRQIHEELAPYTVEVLQEALGEDEEDWETLLA